MFKAPKLQGVARAITEGLKQLSCQQETVHLHKSTQARITAGVSLENATDCRALRQSHRPEQIPAQHKCCTSTKYGEPCNSKLDTY